jgi:parallel beta-helix repeat protein
MRLFYFLFFFAGNTVRGSTYYFSSLAGDDSRTAAQARHRESPWRTLDKLNTYLPNLQPGDSVLFQRGSIFTGFIRITRSGTSDQPIVFSAYGTGNTPIISGFTKLNGWKSIGKGIWQSDCRSCGLKVNMLTISGKPVPMGRTPNTDDANGGFFTIQSHVKNQSVKDDNLGKLPDWTGAEIVIRKNRFILDKSLIVSQTGNTIVYKGGSYYEPTDQFGYFIQNDIRTLDRRGEWYYDPGTRAMNLYFGETDPSGVEIKVSAVDTLVVIKNQSWIAFQGLSFEGSNLDAFNLVNTNHVRIADCIISFSGMNAIKATQTDKMTIGNLLVTNSNNNAIDLNGADNLVQDNKISKTGNITGMGTGEASYIGINIKGNRNVVEFNQIDLTGYVPVFFLGSLNIIRNNVIGYFAFVKDDGGGIYTWSGDIDTTVHRNTGSITGNIILDGITAPEGTDRKQAAIAYGIYLDENTGMTEVTGNTISRCTGGIFLQDAHEITVNANTIYDNGFQIGLRHPLAKGTLRNNRITDNIAAAATAEQIVLVLSSAVSGDVSTFAEFENNKYAQPSLGQGSFYKVVSRTIIGTQMPSKGNMDQWKSGFGKDGNSRIAYPAGAVLFEYNKEKNARHLTLNATYTDLNGRSLQGEIMLPPFSSVLLFKKQ